MRARLKKLLDVLSNSLDGHPALRRAALARAASLGAGSLPAEDRLPDDLSKWIDRVAREAWKTTDDDVAALRAKGVDEDTIYEATVAAAVGAGVARYQVALAAIEAARPSGAASGNG